MKKIKIYKTFKISTDRLARENYNINLTYSQGVINEEVIGLGSSQLVRKLIEVIGAEDNEYAIMDYYVSIFVVQKQHYKHVLRNGFILNGHKYVRFNCSASNARNSSVFFIREDIFNRMFEIMCCGANPFGKEMVLAKWNAYFSLNASSTFEIREPRVAVVNDYCKKVSHNFDYILQENKIVQGNIDVEDYNVFDGMGVMDKDFAKSIQEDMGLDAPPSVCIIRNTFIKGAVATMDFKKFGIVNNVEKVVDVWGVEHNIYELDMILTVSQFKMYKEYQNFEEYVSFSHKYGLSWGVTRAADAEDKRYTFTNYQFLQVLNLDSQEIKDLCKPTIEWINSITGEDANKAILYLCGFDNHIKLDKIEDSALKALLYNHDLIKDSYLKMRILRSLNKKIHQAYSGKLLVDGNFGFMVSDPYALLEWATGLPPVGLLKKEEYFNGFWNRRNVSCVSSCRSPLTWVSENNILHLSNREELTNWYQHIDNCCTVYNIYGVDTFLAADSDFDGDLVFTTNNTAFIKGKNQEYVLPITYEKVPAEKIPFNINKLGYVDMLSFGSRIGFITNCSTYWYSLLPKYEKGSDEYNEIIKRLKCCRKAQGGEIDKTKGIKVEPFPVNWYSYSKDNSEIENKLIVNKKPYFQKYIYPSLSRKYREFQSNFDMYSLIKYGVPFSENTTKDFLEKYNSENPVNDSNSVVNSVCHYLETQIKEIKALKQENQNALDDILIDYDREIDFDKGSYFLELFKLYKQYRQNMRECNAGIDRQQKEENKLKFKIFCNTLKERALYEFGNSIDVANLVVYVCYELATSESKEFAWDVFGDLILDNVKKNSNYVAKIPVEEENGDISYLGYKFREMEVL